MTAEPLTFVAACGAGHPDATWHSSPATAAGGHDSTRVACPACDGPAEPEPDPSAPSLLSLSFYTGPIGALIAATARKVLP